MSINERIKQLRKELKLTQTEFGEKIGLKVSTISKIELGGGVSEQNIKFICEVFHVRRDWLLYGTGEQYDSGEETDPILLWAEKLTAESGDSFPRRLASCLAKFSPDEWAKFESILMKVISEFSRPVDDEEQKRREIEKKVAAYREKLLFEAREDASKTSSISPTSRRA